MSPRLASTMSMRSAGTRARSPSSTRQPGAPCCSKKAALGLTAQTWSRVASRISAQRRSASTAEAQPAGSRPTQRSDPLRSDASRSRAAKPAGVIRRLPDVAAGARLDGALVGPRGVGHLEALVLGRAAAWAELLDAAVEQHAGEAVDRERPPAVVTVADHRHGISVAGAGPGSRPPPPAG